MVYLPGVLVGAITGVAVMPPGHRMPAPRPPLAGGVHVLVKCFFHNNSPCFNVDGVDVVRNAGDDRNLLDAGRGVRAIHDQRRKQRVHLARFVVQMKLPEQLHVLDGGRGEDLFVLLPRRTLRVAAVGEPVRAPKRNQTQPPKLPEVVA